MPDQGDEDESRPHRLKRLFVRGVDFVDRAANRRKFLLLKSEGGIAMPELTEQEAQAIEEALNTPMKDEAGVLAKLVALAKAAKAELAGPAKAACISALRILEKYADELKAAGIDIGGLVAAAGAAPSVAAADTAPKGAAADKIAPTKAEAKKAEIPPEVLAIAKSAETAEAYEAVIKAAEESPALVALFIPMLKSRDVKIADLEKGQKAGAEEADDRAVEGLVDSLDLPGERAPFVAHVKSLAPEQRATFEQIAKGWSGIAALGELGKEAGTPRRGTYANSATERVRQRARELVTKDASKKLTEEDAMIAVLNADRALFAEYRAEQTAGVGS